LSDACERVDATERVCVSSTLDTERRRERTRESGDVGVAHVDRGLVIRRHRGTR
jgi:hypothetical protein